MQCKCLLVSVLCLFLWGVVLGIVGINLNKNLCMIPFPLLTFITQSLDRNIHCISKA